MCSRPNRIKPFVIDGDELAVLVANFQAERLPDFQALRATCRLLAQPICCPLTEATRRLFDDAAFAAMKAGAILVNVTRGEVVDDDALVRALESGRLGGAGLDVPPIEPLPADHPLWRFDNVVMTPHTAGASQHRGRRNLERFCANLRRYRAGEDLLGLVDKRAGY